MTTISHARHILGASRLSDEAWEFRVWAPDVDSMMLRLYGDGDSSDHPMSGSPDGYYGAVIPHVGASPVYRFVLPDGTALADPASRWQPEGVHGPSRGFDPADFLWDASAFTPEPLAATVIYELHIGTFTPLGTFDAAIEELDDLVALGVTAVEPMPINAFPGTRNWGYDGVFPFAVQHSYGGPAAFQRFVAACHNRGLAVILDVVYNHLGPEGNVLNAFGPYFTEVYATPWGEAVNVAEAGSDNVRRYFTDNALMWLRDFHVDGLRLDAIHGIVDPTASPFLRELTAEVRALSASVGRPMVLIAESADNNPLVISPAEIGGLGFDSQWNDDFHHALHTVLTGERDGYYQDYGPLEDLAKAWRDGFSYQGEYSAFRGRRHGARPHELPGERFVVYSQDHDQVGNRSHAERLISISGAASAQLAAAAVLLSPFVPMLFMGEEYGEIAPFPYFIDHSDPDLVEAVRRGRAREFGRDGDAFDPAAEATMLAAQLDRSRREEPQGRSFLALYRILLTARRDYPVLTGRPNAPVDSTVAINGTVLTVRRQSPNGSALIALNFGSNAGTADIESGEWRRVLHSPVEPDPLSPPASLDQGDVLHISPLGFALYVDRTNDERHFE